MSLPSLSKSQKARCLEVLNGVERFGISKVFSKPVDPVLDNCPDYHKIIKNPMDLGTVRKNLNSDKYRSVREWRNDMELIWENARLFNGDDSIITTCAEQLKQVYQKLSETIGENQVEDWMKELESIDKKIHKIKKRIFKEVEEGNLQYVKGEESQTQTHEKPSRKAESHKVEEEMPIPKPVRKPIEDEVPPPKVMVKKEEPEYRPPTPPPPQPVRSPTPPPPPPKQAEAPPSPNRTKKISIESLNKIYDEFCNANDDDLDVVTDIIAKFEGIDPNDQPVLDIPKLKFETQLKLAEFLHVPVKFE